MKCPGRDVPEPAAPVAARGGSGESDEGTHAMDIRLPRPYAVVQIAMPPPEVHGAALVAAQAAGKSLNQWATEVLEEATHA